MWVIIVNSYANVAEPTADEAKERDDFTSVVQAAMREAGKGARIDNRSLEELDELLYAARWGFAEEKALQAFDHIDMVFFRGSTSVLPWFRTARKVRAAAHCPSPPPSHRVAAPPRPRRPCC